MSDTQDDFFIGWSQTAPKPDRRFLLAASLGLLASGATAGIALGRNGLSSGPGQWQQSEIRLWAGTLLNTPYPALLTQHSGAIRTALLATSGKTGVGSILPHDLVGTAVTISASKIARGENMMLAVSDAPDWVKPAPNQSNLALDAIVSDLGEVALSGEILDAKCWFGAMRPGFGKTHKSCAALCARGELPLAFCRVGTCGDGLSAPLFLNANGRPHGTTILPFLADPVLAIGRLLRVRDQVQFRVAPEAIRRL
jgi:hypothetical protein